MELRRCPCPPPGSTMTTRTSGSSATTSAPRRSAASLSDRTHSSEPQCRRTLLGAGRRWPPKGCQLSPKRCGTAPFLPGVPQEESAGAHNTSGSQAVGGKRNGTEGGRSGRQMAISL